MYSSDGVFWRSERGSSMSRRRVDDAVCLGITVLTGAPIRDALTVSRAAEAARPDLPMVWGGWCPHCSRPSARRSNPWT
jgi:hypothetical protein